MDAGRVEKRRKALLTKPAGVFVQLLGLVVMVVGIGALAMSLALGSALLAGSIALFWYGRQTG